MYTRQIHKKGIGAFFDAPHSSVYLTILLILMTIPGLLFADVVVDNGEAGTSSTGTWAVSGGVDPYGANSLWARNGATYTWSFDSQPAGFYEVSMWWTQYTSRGTAIPVQINYTDGVAQTTVNQQIDGGQWNLLGQYYFDGSGSVTLTASGAYPVSHCADAVQYVLVQANERPVAVIDSILPGAVEVGDEVAFSGTITDDGSIAAIEWTSNLDGVISTDEDFNSTSLSEGTHIISFLAQDDQGIWSEVVTGAVTVGSASVSEVIIDNGEAGTSSTGTWAVSGGADPYGDNSLWARNGATYSWNTALSAGSYEVYMWWTQYPSRSNSVSIQIAHAGDTANVNVNQQTDGGQWNSLGVYDFDGSATVTLFATDAYPVSYSADAVRFVKVVSSSIEADFSANPVSGDMPLTVDFTDLSTSTSGIDSWAWDFDNDGAVDSTDQNPSYEYTEAGNYTVSLTVSGADGSDEVVKTDYIEVIDPNGPIELIIDNDEAGTSSTGLWQPSGATGPWGSESLWSRDGATYTWAFDVPFAGTYEVYAWWTAYTSRSTDASYAINHAVGTAQQAVNQRVDGSQWNSLGQYYFDTTGSVVLYATDPYPVSYSADAIRVVFVQGNPTPVASIDSINPNPADLAEEVTFVGHGSSPSLDITGWEWTSDRDGLLSTDASFSTTSLSEGTHQITFRVKDEDEQWSSEVSASIEIRDPAANIEYIYCCFGYYTLDGSQRNNLTNYLNSIATYNGNNVWTYYRPDKTYVISYVDSIEDMAAALRVKNSHILYSGHSNYGLGPAFANQQETIDQEINDLYFVDDDRILNISSEWVHVSVSGMRTGQAYPYWWSNYKDGTSAIMPYEFNDPAGDPAYNYYISYQIPGDPTNYMVDTPRNDPVERFWGSGVTPWFSSTGAKPDPNNPAHHQYFVTNDSPWEPSVDITGDWIQSKEGDVFFKENYVYSDAGSGENSFSWLFRIDDPNGNDYSVYAWWPDDPTGSSEVTYIVEHLGGSTPVTVDQSQGSNGWYLLGEFPFVSGYYAVTVDNNVVSGAVFADAIKVSHPMNPPEIVSADFIATTRTGPAPLEISFHNRSLGDLTGRRWTFGDGFVNETRDDIEHVYTQPGIYTVTLTAYGTGGSDTVTKTEYIHVTAGPEPFQCEFYAYGQEGEVSLATRFRTASSGNIASYLWDFGDGETSTSGNPTHYYEEPGIYDVSLTVTSADTNEEITVLKEQFVRALYKNEDILDNVDYPKRHFSSKTVLKVRDFDVPKDEIRCKRVFYYSCNSGNYYLDTFSHIGGVVFYTLNTSHLSSGQAFQLYLYGYFNGDSDNTIWSRLQAKEAIYDYYDFSKRPDEQ